MKCFTVEGGSVRFGIALTSDANRSPRVRVGEAGRGRRVVLAPVPEGAQVEGRTSGTPCPNSGRLGPDFLPEGARSGSCPDCGAWTMPDQPHEGWREAPAEGVMTTAPSSRGAADARSAVILIRDHSGFRGGWHLRAARPPEEWDAIVGRAATHRPPDGTGALAEGHSLDGECQGCLAAGLGSPPPERPHGLRLIAEGAVAQGDAGRMGGGPEFLGVLAVGQAVEIVRTGRLYGAPGVVRIENADGEVVVTFPRKEALTRYESRRVAAAW